MNFQRSQLDNWAEDNNKGKSMESHSENGLYRLFTGQWTRPEVYDKPIPGPKVCFRLSPKVRGLPPIKR